MFRLERIDFHESSQAEVREIHLTGSIGLTDSPTQTRLSFSLTEEETAVLVRLVNQAAQRALLSMLPPMSPDLAYAVATAVASAFTVASALERLESGPAPATEPA